MAKLHIFTSRMVAILLMAYVWTGCTERDLEYRIGGNVHIAIEWVDVVNPTGAVFYFYPTDGSEPIIAQTPASGFSGDLPTGEYDVLVFSRDPQNLTLTGLDKFATATINAIRSGSKIEPAPGYIGMGNYIEGKGKLTVPERRVVYEDIKALQQTHTFHITFAMQGSFGNVTAISGSLLGTSPSILCYTAKASTERVATDYITAPKAGSSNLRVATTTGLGFTTQTGSWDMTFDVVRNGLNFTGNLDLSGQIEAITEANKGKLPLDVYIYVLLNIGELNQILTTATVRDWAYQDDAWAVID